MRAALGFDRQYTTEMMGHTMNVKLTLSQFNALGKSNPDYVDGAYVGPAKDAEIVPQDYANLDVIQAMRESGLPYYWVNVGVHKHFTQDLNAAREFAATNGGDSIYQGDGEMVGIEIPLVAPTPKPHGIRFCADQFNNVRRMCTVSGTDAGRVWKVRNAMRDSEGKRYYLVMNIETREFLTVSSNRMGNLY